MGCVANTIFASLPCPKQPQSAHTADTYSAASSIPFSNMYSIVHLQPNAIEASNTTEPDPITSPTYIIDDETLAALDIALKYSPSPVSPSPSRMGSQTLSSEKISPFPHTTAPVTTAPAPAPSQSLARLHKTYHRPYPDPVHCYSTLLSSWWT
jgi:hypothetical protein